MARTQILVQRWKVVVFKPIVLLKFSLPSCRWIFVVITWTRMLDGKANGCSQWFLSHRSVASGLEKPAYTNSIRQTDVDTLMIRTQTRVRVGVRVIYLNQTDIRHQILGGVDKV